MGRRAVNCQSSALGAGPPGSGLWAIGYRLLGPEAHFAGKEAFPPRSEARFANSP